ncbi:protein-L-isoaspartate O-methyltransferase [Vibrio sp. MACH09]|uniref:protein-L-isoaspartate(D-aspartate) O-methyltransferase n=1 Tax=unclassified Vibrio TaxID=2614977 RepID=UPI0014934CD1|nr:MULTISPECIES: protein-L-isoaspartate(D-aspartate) O-methyltransferase [unclassified Vibrio]NOI67311.1 protein-L-isoaspartate(D-aspartate) O-methyltransferase [Vibrio sp. 99-8-1]GLO59923.1 protein-L-isoaspartate O-methyltransferase [Vibrio sp. MACH09]
MSSPYVEQLIEFLKVNGVKDNAVLDAIARVPREQFISEALRHQAYDNNALPIAHGQTISQPYIVAKMTELLELNSSTRVLEVGTGSGYQTAVLAQLVDKVYSVERIKSLQWEAKRRLKQLDIYNVTTKHADGWQGWENKGPFDAIVVTAAASQVPEALTAQLAENGRLVIPVGEDNQQLLKIVRHGDSFTSTIVEPVRFVPLIAGNLA